MDITFPNLGSINGAVSMEFNSQLGAAESRYKGFTKETTSTGAFTLYPRLNMIPGLRRWTGDRVVNSLSQVTFSINNELFESTIGIDRADIEDDRLNLLSDAGAELGESAARLPDLLVSSMLKNGHQTLIYDGQNFFDTAHPDFSAPSASGQVSQIASPNYVAGSGPMWFLFDISRVQRPLVFQRRRAFTLIPKFSMVDPQVFWNKEFQWGVDGRCNAGFGIWQYGFMSMAPLTMENLLAARTQMANYRRPDGAPMGVRGTLLVCGSGLYASNAKPLTENPKIPNTLSSQYTASMTVTEVPNIAFGLFKAMEDEWLN